MKIQVKIQIDLTINKFLKIKGLLGNFLNNYVL